MPPSLKRVLLVIGLVLLLAAVSGCQVTATSSSTQDAAPAVTVTTVPEAKPPQAADTAATPRPRPTATGQATARPKPTTVAPAKPAAPVEVDREKLVRDAIWAPSQLQSHFEKHGGEGPWASESVYDASAREVVKAGTLFTYVDRESNVERLGFFDKVGNRFTSLTRDGRRITTHFRPDRGEAYVRGLYRSTYR